MFEKSQWLRIGCLTAFLFSGVPLAAQEPGTGPVGPPSPNPGLPFENAASGSLVLRRPGLIIREGLRPSRDITQTEEERDSRPRETRKLTVQLLLSILDGLQTAIMNFLGGLNLASNLGGLTDVLGANSQPVAEP